MDNFSANHSIWQQRLRKERQAVKIHVEAYYPTSAYSEMTAPKVARGPTGAEAQQLFLNKLYGSESQPVLPGGGVPRGGPQAPVQCQIKGNGSARPPLGAASRSLSHTHASRGRPPPR